MLIDEAMARALRGEDHDDAELKLAAVLLSAEYTAQQKIITDLAAKVDRLRGRVGTLEGHLNWIGWSSEGVAKAKTKLERLQAVLAPFAAVAAGIPENWPDDVWLQIDRCLMQDGGYREWINYWERGDDGETLDCPQPTLPTIGQWRAAEAAKGGEKP